MIANVLFYEYFVNLTETSHIFSIQAFDGQTFSEETWQLHVFHDLWAFVLNNETKN